MSVMMIVMAVGNTAAPIIAVAKAAGAAADFFAVIDTPVTSTDGLKDPQIAHGDIAFESVTFAYPSRPHVRILDNLSVRFRAGKLTAIVGASGCGKSTIVGLLERWYDLDAKERVFIPASRVKTNLSESVQLPEDTEEPKEPIPLSGSITLGGHNLQEIDLKFLRAQIGLVQQEPFLFNDSIFKNVAYGLVGTEWEDKDEKAKRALVEEACKEAFADEFINQLPEVGEFSATVAVMSSLENTDLLAGVRYPGRRCRYQIKRRPEAKIGNCEEYHKTTHNSDS
jgi:ABC-type multidrug transport system fused ATPase/permease subunit